jgi:hypothetical protein
MKQCALRFTLVCCVLCELYESVLALECCESWGVAGVKAASPVCWQLPSREKIPILIHFFCYFSVSPMGHSAETGM